MFLVGGTTKATAPVAMYLCSGDITVMSGPSRLAYHAIPRVLPYDDGELPQCLEADTVKASGEQQIKENDCQACSALSLESDTSTERQVATDRLACPCGRHSCDACMLNQAIAMTVQSLNWKQYAEYIQTHRINLNVRQVLEPGQTLPE